MRWFDPCVFQPLRVGWRLVRAQAVTPWDTALRFGLQHAQSCLTAVQGVETNLVIRRISAVVCERVNPVLVDGRPGLEIVTRSRVCCALY